MDWLKLVLDLFIKKKETSNSQSLSASQGSIVTWTRYTDPYVLKKIDRALEVGHLITNVMGLKLVRNTFTKNSTIGVLYVNGREECYTLEDHERLERGDKKIAGVTAIPRGHYDVGVSYSPKFKTRLPIVKDVPGFTGIRIHPGNTDKDTEGCILVGTTRGKDFIGASRKAFNKLFRKIEDAIAAGKRVTLTIEGAE